MTIIVYCDGASSHLQDNRYGGIGIYCETSNKSISCGYSGKNITNQRMELIACLMAIKNFNNENEELLVLTDSMYVINCITKWTDQWIKNGWMRKCGNKFYEILHLDLIKELHAYYVNNKIKFEHVRSHRKEPDKKDNLWNKWYGNMMADKLAVNAKEQEINKKIDNKILKK